MVRLKKKRRLKKNRSANITFVFQLLERFPYRRQSIHELRERKLENLRIFEINIAANSSDRTNENLERTNEPVVAKLLKQFSRSFERICLFTCVCIYMCVCYSIFTIPSFYSSLFHNFNSYYFYYSIHFPMEICIRNIFIVSSYSKHSSFFFFTFLHFISL